MKTLNKQELMATSGGGLTVSEALLYGAGFILASGSAPLLALAVGAMVVTEAKDALD